MQKRLLVSFILSLFLSVIFAQTNYPQNYFSSPIKGVIHLAGNFGEVRPNHLHGGFDIKTGGKEGMPIYAVADGFVSRIKISPWGYGNALYIDHPNGYTSVYAHLKKFNDTIAAIAKAIQYAEESFEIDTNLTEGYYRFRKGELIGYSGNTGGSQGPHLHFEIRDTESENPINPYYFGYKVKDLVKPRIRKLGIYPVGDNVTINGKQKQKISKVYYGNGTHYLGREDTITVYGDIGFGIDCYDSESSSNNHNGVFSIEMQSDGKRVYYSELEQFAFDKSRYVNAHIDYAEKQAHRLKIQKCYLVKNNELGICKEAINDGVVRFNDDSLHRVKFILKDFQGNKTVFSIKVKSTSKGGKLAPPPTNNKYFFDCKKPNEYKTDNIEVTLPVLCLYEDIAFKVVKKPRIKWTYSPLFQVQNAKTGAHKKYNLRIKAVNLPDSLQSKAFIISVGYKQKRRSVGGTYTDGWVETNVKKFGAFAITVDTKAPVIKPKFKVVDKNNVDLRNYTTISVKVGDNLSGIKKYKGMVDGKWVLFEYEAKKGLLYYTFDERVPPGKHTFTMEVTDAVNNVGTYECSFVR